ncbi:hypothetical protein [Vreelandella azerica]|uniref:hypothetical protein n=1 Tax=Vreelandella azerica TaxID=2732867 RepID=UPI001F35B304|nr:hypothetical protein [Halomonas azerica]
MDLKLKQCINILLLCFLIVWPVVDTVNGYFYYHNVTIPSISAPYKALGFIGLMVALLIYHVRLFIYALLCALLITLCLFYQVFIYGHAVESITWAVRGLLTLALLFYLIGEAKHPSDFWNNRKIAWLMFFYFFIMSMNVTLGVFGVGESQYAGELAVKASLSQVMK